MKKFLLAVHNLKYMIENGNRLFFIVLTSMSLSVFGMLFYSGYFLYSYYSSEDGSKITITPAPDSSGEEICRLLSQLKSAGYTTKQVQLLPDSSGNGMITGEYNLQWDKDILLGKNYSFEENRPYVIMPEFTVDFVENGESPIGFQMEEDADLHVYGIVPYTETDSCCVPVNYYAMHYPTGKINYRYAEKLDKKTVRMLEGILENSRVVDSFRIIRSSSPFLSTDFMWQFVQILLIFSVMVINIFCMAYSWIIHFKRNYRIYAVCGAAKTSIVGIIMFQTFLLMSASVLAGNILFFICRILLKNTSLVYQQSCLPYVEVSALLMVILMIFSVLIAKRAAQADTIYQVRE